MEQTDYAEISIELYYPSDETAEDGDKALDQLEDLIAYAINDFRQEHPGCKVLMNGVQY